MNMTINPETLSNRQLLRLLENACAPGTGRNSIQLCIKSRLNVLDNKEVATVLKNASSLFFRYQIFWSIIKSERAPAILLHLLVMSLNRADTLILLLFMLQLLGIYRPQFLPKKVYSYTAFLRGEILDPSLENKEIKKSLTAEELEMFFQYFQPINQKKGWGKKKLAIANYLLKTPKFLQIGTIGRSSLAEKLLTAYLIACPNKDFSQTVTRVIRDKLYDPQILIRALKTERLSTKRKARIIEEVYLALQEGHDVSTNLLHCALNNSQDNQIKLAIMEYWYDRGDNEFLNTLIRYDDNVLWGQIETWIKAHPFNEQQKILFIEKNICAQTPSINLKKLVNDVLLDILRTTPCSPEKEILLLNVRPAVWDLSEELVFQRNEIIVGKLEKAIQGDEAALLFLANFPFLGSGQCFDESTITYLPQLLKHCASPKPGKRTPNVVSEIIEEAARNSLYFESFWSSADILKLSGEQRYSLIDYHLSSDQVRLVHACLSRNSSIPQETKLELEKMITQRILEEETSCGIQRNRFFHRLQESLKKIFS